MVLNAGALTGCVAPHIAPQGFYRAFDLYSVRYDRPNDELDVILTTGWYLPQDVTTGKPESPVQHPVDVAAQPTWAKGLATLSARVHGIAAAREPFVIRFPIYQSNKERQIVMLHIQPPPNVLVELDGKSMPAYEADRRPTAESPNGE